MTSTAPIVRGAPVRPADARCADVAGGGRPRRSAGEVRDVFDALAPRTAVALPLRARGRTVGALSIYRLRPTVPRPTPTTSPPLREVADRVALALDNSRLYEQQRRLAEELQRSLLTAPPEPDHAEIVVRYRPAMRGGRGRRRLVRRVPAADGRDRCSSSVTSSATTPRPRRRWASCAGMLRGIAYRDGLGPGRRPHRARRRHRRASAWARWPPRRSPGSSRRPRSARPALTRLRWSNAGPPAAAADPRRRPDRGAGRRRRAELMLGVDPRGRAHRDAW